MKKPQSPETVFEPMPGTVAEPKISFASPTSPNYRTMNLPL